MRSTRRARLGISVAVAALALTAVGQASAAITSKFVVASNEAINRTTLTYEQGASDDTLARLALFAPTTVFLPAAQTPGDRVGKGTITAAGGVLNGTIAAAVAGGPGGPTVVNYDGKVQPLSTLWQNCVGTPQPGPANTSNYWLFLSGSTVIPFFFSSINQDQPFGEAFLGQLVGCFPASMKVTKVSLTLISAVSTSPGVSTWHSLASPWAGAAIGQPSAEAEAADALPWNVTLKAHRVKAGVSISGKVTQSEPGKGVANATVKIKSGKSIVKTVKTRANGTYKAVLKLRKATRLVAHATSEGTASASCKEPKFAPARCTGGSRSGVDVTSDEAAIKK